MKKIIIFSALLLISTFNIVSAKSIGELRVSISQDINKDCKQPDGYDPVRGCYINSAKQIFIRDGLPKEVLPYILIREMGHYFTVDVSDERLNEVFNPLPLKLQCSSLREVVADEFATWFFGGYAKPIQDKFFREILK
jgi:hypothetical protein